jgi:uncharacterized phage-associated protein
MHGSSRRDDAAAAERQRMAKPMHDICKELGQMRAARLVAKTHLEQAGLKLDA